MMGELFLSYAYDKELISKNTKKFKMNNKTLNSTGEVI